MILSYFQTLGLAGAVAAAVAASAPCAAQPQAETQIRIRFSLDSKFQGPAAPFLVALDRGYFKAEGLDVALDTGADSSEAIKRIASGAYEMGFGDINALIKFRDTHSSNPIKPVFMVYNKPAYAIIGRRSRGVTTPKDLEGKTLGAPAADVAFAQWKIFASANGIDVSKVKIENVGLPVREPMLQNGQVDAITGLSFTSFINLKSMGVPADDLVLMLMADYGVELYGNAIMVGTKFASTHPDAVKSFLRAFLKALRHTVKDPSNAVDSVIKRNDSAKKSVELERLRIAVSQNILTPEVKADGYGAVNDERLTKAIAQLALTYNFKNGKPNAADTFDSSFLPPQSERKAN
jgi:NitT/TauT family transport system substrate-binding protein